MSAVPPFRQIQFDQIPGAPNWFAAFLTALNQFLSAIYDMANGGTTFGDNIPRQLKTLPVTVAADGKFPVQSFKSTLRTAPQAVLLAQAQVTSGTAGTVPISLNQWTYLQGMVQLDSIVGLQAGNSYSLTFLVL